MTSPLVDLVVHWFAVIVGLGITLNVLDELFVDCRYFFWRLNRRANRVIPEEALRNVEQKRIAIMLPAWKEADVIEQMLAHNLERIDYDHSRVDFFCGTYQNDPETQARVAAVSRRFKNVHKVVVPHDGPTSKADCLNWVYQGILLREQESGKRYDILLMQDAEDIIHPQALRLYSLMIPRYEFVQTPVFSLPLAKTKLVAGTYIDEFSEHHLKDMRVRESIGGLIPSAGVGSGFDRDAFEAIATAHGQHPFNVDSLTEDYEIGLKFRLANRRAHFACHTIERVDANGKKTEEFIATREFFPSHFGASVRQRSRWILGITLQTWAQLGWVGAPAVLYCLWRDRKALVMNMLVLCAYALVGYTAARSAIAHASGETWSFEAVMPATSPFFWMLLLNSVLAAWRLVMKATFVGRLYGWSHAALSLPRIVIANTIGILATTKAVVQYARHKWSGKPLRWLKTAHEFPCLERLTAAARRTLADLVLERRLLSSEELDEAVALHRATGMDLGDVLHLAGLLPPNVVAEALAEEHELDVCTPDPSTIAPDVLRRLPEPVAEELDVLPVDERDGKLVLAAAHPLEDDARARLESAAGAPIEVRLCLAHVLRRARDEAYRRLVEKPKLDKQQLAAQTPATTPGGYDIDRRSILKLGLGFCAFHGVVPIRTSRGPAILYETRLHPSVLREIDDRLGTAPRLLVCAPASMRSLLAAAEGSLPSVIDELGLFGLDAAEWRALRMELPADPVLAEHVKRACLEGRSPIDHLEQIGTPPDVVARARSRTFGLKIAPSLGTSAAGLLPSKLATEHAVTVLRRGTHYVELAAPRPTPRLAQRVATLLSPLRVSWSIAPSQRSAS